VLAEALAPENPPTLSFPGNPIWQLHLGPYLRIRKEVEKRTGASYRRRRFWRISVVILSASVEILTGTSEWFSNVLKRPQKKTPEFSHIAGFFICPVFGIVDATEAIRRLQQSRTRGQ
jgi:hypothetical protein